MNKNIKIIYNDVYKIFYTIFTMKALMYIVYIYIRCTNRPGICTTNRLD